MSIGMRSAASTAALALTLALAAPAHAEKVRVAHAGSGASYLSMYAAVENGYYKGQGIDIERTDVPGAASTPALIAGDLEFTFSASVAIGAIMKGARLKVVFVTGDRPTYRIWARPEFNAITDLKGQQMGIVARGDTSEIAMRAFLLKRGLSGNYLAYTPLGFSGNRLAALMSGALPASIILVHENHTLENAREQRIRFLYDMTDDVRMVFSGVATTDALISANPDLVRRFVLATQQGMASVKADKKRAIALLGKYAGIPEAAAAEDYESNATAYLLTGIANDEVKSNEIKVRLDMLDMSADKAPPASQIFDMQFAEAGVKKMAADNWKP